VHPAHLGEGVEATVAGDMPADFGPNHRFSIW
jgi:hypothetical protein